MPEPQRGDIWWISAPEAGDGVHADDKARPVVIISRDTLQRESWQKHAYVVVPFFSRHVERRRKLGQWAYIEGRSGGFNVSGCGSAADITAVDRLEFLPIEGTTERQAA
jgi:mRNA-degrading endonuclease toxin of MazEF toxin-antitoxin module